MAATFSRVTCDMSAAGITVRPAQARDVDTLVGLWCSLMAVHEQTDPAFTLTDEAAAIWRRSTLDMLSRRDSFVCVIELADVTGPVGLCSGWVAKNPPIYAVGDVGFVSEIVVSAQHRRRGLGRGLIAYARRWFLRRGLEEFQLSCAAWNSDAQAFWQSIGGQPLLLRYRFMLDDTETLVEPSCLAAQRDVAGRQLASSALATLVVKAEAG